MSIYNSQDYNDAWDDMPPSLQEQLLQDVAQLESGAVLTSTTIDQPLLLQDVRNTKKQKRYHDEQMQLKVYKDPLLNTSPIPELRQSNTVKAKAQLLDRTNQQHLSQLDPTVSFDKKRRSPSPPPPTQQQREPVTEPNSSDTDIIDDDDMWLEFDDMDIPALLEDIENNHRNTLATSTHNPLAIDINNKEGMIPPAAITTTPSLAQLDNALQKFGGFQTAGSRKDIKPNDSALKTAHDKALALMAEPLPSTPTVSSSNSPTMPKSSTLSPPRTCDLITPILGNSAPSFASGFSTARGMKLKEPSLDAKRKAQQLILVSPTRPSPPPGSIYTASYNSDSDTPRAFPDMTSFATGSSLTNDTESIEPRMDTKKLLQTSPMLSVSSSSLSLSSDTLNKDPFQLLTATTEHSIYQYEDVLQQFGGFSKASGKKVDTVISEVAKQQALALFTSDTSSTQLTQPSSSSQGRSSSQSEAESTIHTASMQTSTDASLVDTSTTAPHVSSPPTTDQQQKDTKLDSISTPSSLSVSPSPPAPSPVAVKTTAPVKRRVHPQRDNKRPRSKPFKSPAVNLDLIRAGLEKRVSTTASNRMKGPSVFDMHPIGCRRPLSSLGQPCRYSKETLISMNIPAAILDMTPCKARSFMFSNNWGIQDAEKELIAAGASSSMIPDGWIENHYGWIVWKLAMRLCMFPHYAQTGGCDWWSREHVMNQLLYRYEREVNLGQRPVLRRIMEQDDVPVKQMVLMVADIVCVSSSSSSCGNSMYRLQLTDGWYQISTCVDSKMNSMISQGRVYIGQKLSITGAQLTGDFTPKTPLEALTMAGPDSPSPRDVTSTTLMISSNSCLPCPWDATLGYPRRRLRRQVIRRLDTNIYENGGLITMMEVVICKKYPMMYSETMDSGMVVNRNSKDEDDYRRLLGQQARASNSQDRRVSGHFRLRICDTNKPAAAAAAGRSTVVATLLVTNTLEIMHMDLVEGHQYRLYFVQPYQPRNKTLEGPSLITTRLTKWEPLKSPTIKASPLDQSYPLRSICVCADIKELTMADVDMAVLVLHTQPATSQQYIDGRKAWYSTLLVTDTSLTLCQITCRSFYRPVQDMNGQILGLMNVRFMLYDAKCDIIHIKSSNETEIWTSPTGAMVFMQHAMKGLKQWTESEPSGLAFVRQRVKDLIQS